MPVKFKCGNVNITIKDMTEESLESLLSDPFMKIFLPYNSDELFRKAFYKALETGNWEEVVE